MVYDPSTTPFHRAFSMIGDRLRLGHRWPWMVFAASFVVLAALTLALVRSSETARTQQAQAQWWRAHTLDVLISTEQLDTALNRTLRGERGYVLTSHPRSLNTFRQGLDDYARLARRLRDVTRDNPLQQRRLFELDRRVDAFARLSRQVVARVGAGDRTSAVQALRTGREREAVEDASLILDAIKAEERRLLAVRETANAASSRRTEQFARIVLGLAAALLMIVAGTIAAMLRARAAAARAADAVKASERLYRLMAEHSNDMIVCLGLDGVRRYVSPASLTLLGYTADEMVGGAPASDIHVEDRARVFEVCRTLLDGAENPVCAYRQRHRDGRYVWLEASYRLVRDAGGTPVEFVASVRDISQRRAVEIEAADAAARLDDNNRLFAMAASLARIGHWRVDLMRGELCWSSEVHRIHEVGPDYVPRLTDAIALYHPDDRDAVSRMIDESIANGTPFEFSATLLLADGTTKSVAVQGQAERAPDGTVVGVFGIIQDVSAQVAAAEATRASERQYRLLADNATDVVLRTDDAGSVTYVSPSCVDLSGFAATELTGRACAEFIHPDDHAVVHAAHVAIITGEQSAMTVEYRLRLKGGGWCWLESHMKPWRAPEDSDGGVISAIRDIGGRKVLEEELVAARDAAEAAARAKSAFLANMSHEIRTPMNGVLGFTEVVLAGELQPDQRRHLELIAESGRSMMRLLNDILDVSRIESGKMQVAEEPVDLRHVIRRCTDLMRPVAEAKGVSLSAAVDAGVPNRVTGDPLRVRQILLNLVGNALKFTEHGAVAVRGHVEGDRLRLDVVDTGIGIAPDRLGAIFEQFAQADERTAERYGGTGLGLAISGNLARLMGGSISVRSVVGEGSTFSVVLPLRPVEEIVDGMGPAVPAVDREETRAARPRAPRVLIAEDHDINQALITAMAERAGMEPEIAADGLQAIAMIERAVHAGRPYELVLMDMQMPILDGLEATRRLRAAGYGPDTLPIVALTANAYAEDIRACLDAGMQAHLAKPVRVRDLTDLLTRCVSAGAPAPVMASVTSPKLVDRYRMRKVETIRALDALIADDRPDPAIVATAADMLHKLAGTAGMFGEADLGEKAKRLEDLLGDWSSADDAGPIRDAVLDLRDAA